VNYNSNNKFSNFYHVKKERESQTITEVGGEKMKDKITCRPCKEQNNWEIEDQYGEVLDQHYSTKESCVKAGERIATECGCELCICED